MDLTQLRTFVTVAEELHLTRAAERLHISQPAASAHIRAIEKYFDVVLFERGKRNLQLTPAGNELMRQAKRVLAESQAFHIAAKRLGGQIMGSLYLGSNNDPALSHVADMVAQIRAAHPLVMLNLRSLSTASALQSIRMGELDGAFVLARSVDDAMGSVFLRHVKYLVAGSSRHWGEILKSGNWQAIAGLPWITTAQGNAYAQMLSAMFSDKGLELNSAVNTDNDNIIRELIHAGVGISLVREDIALAAERQGALTIWPLASAMTSLMFVYPLSRAGDPLMNALVSTVRGFSASSS
jgi:DNA-binding transcriptional LysR family regulator